MSEFCPEWQTIKEFAGLKPINVFHKEYEKNKSKSAFENLHILARADFHYKSDEKIILKISADDYCKLYINGDYIWEGPAPSFHNHYYFCELDITKFLKPGKNIFAVHLYYQGLINRVWQSDDNRFGIGAVLTNGKGEENLSFRYKICNAYSGNTMGYDTDFSEDFDSRAWDNDWNKANFNQSAWDDMITVENDYTFIKQPTKNIDVYQITPKFIQKQKSGYFMDIGTEICGLLELEAIGKRDDIITIHYAEELNTDGSLRYNLRAGCTYAEKWILDNGRNHFENYVYKGFRYIEVISDDAEITDIRIICRHYPFDDYYCVPNFSDYKLGQVFTLCKNTIKYAVQEGYIDCPTREKGQYLGDAFIAGHSHILLTGNTQLYEKCIDDFARTSSICRGIMAVAPCSLMQEIADYSLLFGEMVLLAYKFNKDINYLEKHYQTIKNIILHFKQYERNDGLLDCVSDKWNLVDWPENLRDSYDFELSRPIVSKGVHNVINAYYIGAVKTLGEIEAIIGKEKSFDAERLKSAYIRTFLRNDNLFADSEISNHHSLHSNAFALYFDLVPASAKDTVCDFIVKKGLCCGVYISYFVLKALSKAGRKQNVYSLIVNESEHGWLNMIREGAATCFEVWGKEQKFNTSLCHPWATAPISIILEDLGEHYVIPDNE